MTVLRNDSGASPNPSWEGTPGRVPKGIFVPPAVEKLVALIGKSGLVTPERLGEFLGRLDHQAESPAEPEALATTMIRDGLLSRFQAQQLLAGKSRGFFL